MMDEENFKDEVKHMMNNYEDSNYENENKDKILIMDNIAVDDLETYGINCNLKDLRVNLIKLKRKQVNELKLGVHYNFVLKNCRIIFDRKPKTVRIRKKKKSDSSTELADNSKEQKTLLTSQECPYTSKHKYKIIQHDLTHKKNQTFSCRDCNFTAKCMYLLKQHKKDHTEKEIITCKYCPFKTNNKTTFLKHKIRHVAPKERKIQCVECSFTAESRTVLQEHSQTHKTSVKVFKCFECAYTSNNKSSLLEHSQMHQNLLNVFRCQRCYFATTNESFLASHERIHPTLKINRKFRAASLTNNFRSTKTQPISQVKTVCNESSLNIGSISTQIYPTLQTESTCIDLSLNNVSINSQIYSNPRVETGCSYSPFDNGSISSQIHDTGKMEAKYSESQYFNSCTNTHLEQSRTHQFLTKLYKCQICTFSTTNKNYLAMHELSHRTPRVDSTFNGPPFANRLSGTQMEQSKAYQYLTKIYKCQKCSFVTYSHSYFSLHEEMNDCAIR